MNKMLLGCLLVGAMSFSSPLGAYYVSASLHGKNDKRVIVLGDLHIANTSDNQHYILCKTFLEKMAQGHQHGNVVLEGNYSICAMMESKQETLGLPDTDFPMIVRLGVDAKKIEFENRSLSYFFCDVRKEKFRDIYQSVEHLADFALEIEALTKDSLLFQKQFRGLAEKIYTSFAKEKCQQKEYTCEIDATLAKLEKLELQQADLLTQNEKLKAYLNHLREQIVVARDFLEAFFQKYPKTNTLGYLLKTILEEKSDASIQNLGQHINVLKADMADLGFIISMIQSQVKKDVTIVITGENHTGPLRLALDLLGYTKLTQEITTTEKEPMDGGRLKDFFSKVLQGKLCTACAQFGLMDRCGMCSNAFYCNRDCQRKDWPKHKLACSKK